MVNPDQIIDADDTVKIEGLISQLEADKGLQVAVVAWPTSRRLPMRSILRSNSMTSGE